MGGDGNGQHCACFDPHRYILPEGLQWGRAGVLADFSTTPNLIAPSRALPDARVFEKGAVCTRKLRSTVLKQSELEQPQLRRGRGRGVKPRMGTSPL